MSLSAIQYADSNSTSLREISLDRHNLTFRLLTYLLLMLGLLVGSKPLEGQTITVLHTFTGSPDGDLPYLGGLVRDNSGNLYGTTMYGGSHNQGTIFTLAGTTETILHTFDFVNGGSDGAFPSGRLLLDGQGNLYGTTQAGGLHSNGTIFRLTPAGVFTVLYAFASGAPTTGATPMSGLAMDGVGNFYGTTRYGGIVSCNCGTVFKLTPSGVYTVLHAFTTGQDGAFPFGALFMDANGNLYGTTALGGGSTVCTGGCGTIFEINPSGSETVLHRFVGIDGAHPYAALTMDAKGDLFGTTSAGGGYGDGAAFMLTASGETVLHSFTGTNGDGAFPYSDLLMDGAGNLYGTTYGGGLHTYGTIFRLTTGGTETILANFGANGDGSGIYSGLVFDPGGNLYGTAYGGGSANYGTVFVVP
jgi:uncharacterized repeat protein (TIGR03803 family)